MSDNEVIQPSDGSDVPIVSENINIMKRLTVFRNLKEMEASKSKSTIERNGEGAKPWNKDDGMTETILSQTEEREFLDMIKETKRAAHKDRRSKSSTARNSVMYDQGEDSDGGLFVDDKDGKWKERREQILDMIEDID